MMGRCSFLARRAGLGVAGAVLSAAILLLLTASPALGFPDVSPTHPYSTGINAVAAAGAIGGFEDGTFGPDKLVTRQQFAKMIVRILGLPVTEADFPGPAVPFVDLGPDNPSDRYPHEYVAACALNGITQGTDATHFSPALNIRRTQVAMGEIAIDALKITKLETIAGPVDFTSPVAAGTLHPVVNVYTSPLAVGQWVRGTTWPYDLTIVGNGAAATVPVQSELQFVQ